MDDLTLEQRMACALAQIARRAWEGGIDHADVTEAMYDFGLLKRATMTRQESEAWGYQNDLYEGDEYDQFAPEILALEKSVGLRHGVDGKAHVSPLLRADRGSP